MSDDNIPAADQLQGVAHPRHSLELFGQSAAEIDFLNAYNSDRLHHAWLLTGNRGVGKATLAWRIARFILSQSANQDMAKSQCAKTLDISIEDPISQRISALSEPRLHLVRRAWDEKSKRFKQNITIDEIRKLKNFFTLSSVDGGWRVVIIDCADEMNISAANALLKILEEPPKNVLMLLIAHQVARLLPTILSRCRTLRCMALQVDDLSQALRHIGQKNILNLNAINQLAEGSVGYAMELLEVEGISIYRDIIAIANSYPKTDRLKIQKMGKSCASKDNVHYFDMTLRLFNKFLSRLAKYGVLQSVDFSDIVTDEGLILSRFAPNAAQARKWADCAQYISQRTQYAQMVNLDPYSIILDMWFTFEKTARNNI